MADGDAEEDEVAARGDDLGLPHEAAGFHAVAMDAEVGDARPVGGEEGDLDLLAVPGLAGCGGGVAAVGEVGVEVEEDPVRPGGVRPISVPIGRRMQGPGVERSVHACLQRCLFSSADLDEIAVGQDDEGGGGGKAAAERAFRFPFSLFFSLLKDLLGISFTIFNKPFAQNIKSFLQI
jgi:hypothetical protein